MATNRIDSLDPALIRSGTAAILDRLDIFMYIHTYVLIYVCAHICMCTGRIDRKIEFPLPDEKTKRRIFQIHTAKMTLADDVNLEEYIAAKDDLSGADIKVS